MIEAIRQVGRLDWFNRASVVYLLLVVPLYWNFEAYDTTLWEKFLVAHLIVIRMAAGWLATSIEGREHPGAHFLDVPILLYLALASVSWLSAINPLKSGMEVIRILHGATIYFSVSRTYKPEFRNAWIAAVFHVACRGFCYRDRTVSRCGLSRLAFRGSSQRDLLLPELRGYVRRSRAPSRFLRGSRFPAVSQASHSTLSPRRPALSS